MTCENVGSCFELSSRGSSFAFALLLEDLNRLITELLRRVFRIKLLSRRFIFGSTPGYSGGGSSFVTVVLDPEL